MPEALKLKKGDLCRFLYNDFRTQYSKDGEPLTNLSSVGVEPGIILEAIKALADFFNYWLFWVPERNSYIILPIDYDWIEKI